MSMISDYAAQALHNERASRFQREAAADRLAKLARRRTRRHRPPVHWWERLRRAGTGTPRVA